MPREQVSLTEALEKGWELRDTEGTVTHEAKLTRGSLSFGEVTYTPLGDGLPTRRVYSTVPVAIHALHSQGYQISA